MLDPWLAGAVEHDPDGVEAVAQPRAPVISLPRPGDAFDLAALQRRDRLQRVTVALTRTRLDLDEGHDVAPRDDQIDLAAAEAIVALQDGVAAPRQVGGGDALTPYAEIVGLPGRTRSRGTARL